jgi:hypothetical protein
MAKSTYSSGKISDRRPIVEVDTLKCAAAPVVTGAKASQAVWFAEDAKANPAIGAHRLPGARTAAK